jgi:hypothetical protein
MVRVLALLALTALAGGCLESKGLSGDGGSASIPAPIDNLLPTRIEFHPFTEAGIRRFDDAGGVKGIETRIRCFDAFSDASKGFGVFRVTLYAYRPDAVDHLGQKGPTWEIDLMDPEVNNTHWDEISRSYKFLLQWDRAIPVGQRYVLRATFSSPWTPRFTTQKVFVAGQ